MLAEHLQLRRSMEADDDASGTMLRCRRRRCCHHRQCCHHSRRSRRRCHDDRRFLTDREVALFPIERLTSSIRRLFPFPFWMMTSLLFLSLSHATTTATLLSTDRETDSDIRQHLLSQGQQSGGGGAQVLPDHLQSLTNYEIIIPRRVDESGKPFPKHQHYLRRNKRSSESSATDEDDLFVDLNVDVDNRMRYKFHAFGRDIHLSLTSDRDFVVDGLRVLHMTDNETWLGAELTDSSRHCFHSGFVAQDPDSLVVLSTCENLLGIVHSFNDRFFIEPLRNSGSGDGHPPDSEADGIPHVIYRHSGEIGSRSTAQHCQTKERTNSADHHQEESVYNDDRVTKTETRSKPVDRASRKKRSMSLERFVEVMVVADAEMKQFHGDDLEHYLLTLMAIVANVYRDQSIGNPINIYVVKIVVWESKDTEKKITTNAATTLKEFCKWQKEVNVADDSDPSHHDTAVLITKQDICRSNQKCDTLGLAELGTMCDSHRSCSIVKDSGLSAAFTIAHELGHVFSLRHDNECSELRNQSHLYHIMAPTLGHETKYWSWSECSRKRITEFIDAGNTECLNDKPVSRKPFPVLNYSVDNALLLPGSVYSVDQQCAHIFESESVRCPYLPVCTKLWCTNPQSERSGCATRHMPWADGTSCSSPGSNESLWCIQGQCVPKKIDHPVDGHWGVWSPYGDCSRTCGGGIKQAKRLCNNPLPSNGGKYCTGRRIKYKSCNHMDCPDSVDFREQQCRSFNGQHFNINGLSPNVQWVAKYSGIESKDRCKLFCRDALSAAYYQLAERVRDGTKCGLDTTDVCVMGHCRKAGCDNRLGSSTARDDCGICGGDNSNCENIRGEFSNDTVLGYGYGRVTRIPKGSTKIDIRQFSKIDSHEDDTYLALKNGSGMFILNGDFILSPFPKTVQLGAKDTLEYTGSRHKIERISGTGPLSDDVEVYVLMVGEMRYQPHIEWLYTVRINATSAKKVYVWTKMTTTNCSHLCQGKKIRKVLCMNSASGAIVSDQHCLSTARKPLDSEKHCNVKCHLKWKIAQVSECAAKCKEKGLIQREVRCQKETINSTSRVEDKFCSHIERPSVSVECIGPCESLRWAYTSWTQCNQSCGGGTQYRKAICQSQGKSLPDSDCSAVERKALEQKCNTDSCPRWLIGNWTHCTVTCGSGWRSRKVSCVQNDQLVAKTRCDSEEPVSKVKCQADLCPQWHIGSYGSCSVTCGKGTRTREIRCKFPTGNRVNDDACDAGSKPLAETVCVGRCSTAVTLSTLTPTVQRAIPKSSPVMVWRTGSWTECSVSCGIGSRERFVSCRDLNGKVASDSLCKHLVKPASIERCSVQSCNTWRTGDWNQCSVTCGQGVETRLVKCVSLEELEGQLFNAAQCDISVMPPTERLCNRNDCLPDRHSNIIAISSNNIVGTTFWRAGPWSPCSSTCNFGIKRRRVLCQDEKGSSANCDPELQPSDEEPCNVGPCPNWNYGQWGQCDVTCGGGYQQRMVRCQLPDGYILPDANCLEFAPPRKQPCGLASCPGSAIRTRWQKGRWTSCSVSCGKGQRQRSVVCVDNSGRHVSDHKCKTQKPKGNAWCRRGRCPVWSTSPWSQCSATCDAGTKQRTVLCTRLNATVESGRCGHLVQPNATEQCLVRKCEPFYWVTGNWSKCSQPCSFGIQIRNVSCVEMANGRDVNVSFCSAYEKPSIQMDCSIVPCSNIWITSDWTRCSVTCGQGLQKRAVSCRAMAREGWLLPTHVDLQSCNQTEKPISERFCSYGDCASLYHWETTSWSQCSETCGFGRAYRESYCFDSNGTKHLAGNCELSLRPPLSRPCYMGPCYSTSCLEVRQRTAWKADGEFNLLLGGKLIPIYCGDMMRSRPKEYITLLADENENYSEIFDKRLFRPGTCPSNLTDLEKCRNCFRSNFHLSGRTKFSKVRLNVTSMQIIGNDFTFAKTHGRRKIPFASAGDCYSRTGNCPQGNFQVNLTGTRFRIVPGVKWHSVGFKTVSQIDFSADRQIVQGRCGGHCGRCSPSNGLKLELIP